MTSLNLRAACNMWPATCGFYHEPGVYAVAGGTGPGRIVRIDHGARGLRPLHRVVRSGFQLSAIIGVIIAYVKRQDVRGTWLESHYTWQIRTFWWSLLIGGVGIILTLLLIGWVVLLGYVVFFIYRVVVGWVALSRRQPI